MHKYHMLRTVLLSTVFALLTIVLMTPVASAYTATSAHGDATATGQIPAVPNVNIVINHGKAVFSPSTIHCKARGLKKACINVTNLTSVTQKTLFRGKTLGTIPPYVINFISASGPGVYFVGLKSNPQAVLTLIAS